jgi:hypothetical protein
LRRGDDQVERLDRRPRPTDMHQPAGAGAAGLALDPSGDGLVAPPRRDHQFGPGRPQWVRAARIAPEQRDAEQAVGQKLGRTVGYAPGLERPVQGLGERQDLAVVAGLLPQ